MSLVGRTSSISFLLIVALVACGGAPSELTGAVEQASQCGSTMDYQAVDSYDGSLGVSKAFVARAEPHVGFALHVTASGGNACSGTLISDDLFLTAAHCRLVVNDTVTFDYQGVRVPNAFAISEVVEQAYDVSETYDYAIVRLAGYPGRRYGHAIVAPVDPPVGTLLTAIHHPGARPKQVSTGPVADYNGLATNWFRFQADVEPGSSGGGLLDTNGRLVGVITNDGCSTVAPYGGNHAMRMSKLVAQSRTLQELSRSKIVWKNTDGRVSIWTLEPNGAISRNAEHGPFPGWTPVSLQNNRLLWTHTDGRISLWKINNLGQGVGFVEYGPFPGWRALNYANNRILWAHTDGRVSLWVVDDDGKRLTYKEHGPISGWTAVNYANDHILWKHTSGQASLWSVAVDGSYLSYSAYGPYAGWSPVSYSNGELFWKHLSGKVSQHSIGRAGEDLSFTENGPFTGWDPVSSSDAHLQWRRANGAISYWNTNSDGAGIGYSEYPPLAGWTALFTAGGRP